MLALTLSLDADRFERDTRAASKQLADDLRTAAHDAAKAGIEAEQASHPYTDRTWQLTERAHVEEGENGDFEMCWPKEYATFVDGRGYDPKAEPSGRFAFTPIAEARAQAALDRGVERALARFRATIERA